MDPNPSCVAITYSDSLRNIFRLVEYQQIIVLTLGPIAAVFAIFNIIFLVKVPSARQPPADILFFISIFSLIAIAGYLTTVTYDRYNPTGIGQPVPSDFADFCIGTGFLSLTSELGQLVYNTVFCIYYVIKIKNPLKGWVNQNKQVHIICFILIGLSSSVFYIADAVGVSILGICQLRVSSYSPFISFGLSILYLAVLVISSVFFLKYLRKISKKSQQSKRFLIYYFKYLIIVSINNIVQDISLLILGIFCNQETATPIFYDFVTVATISNLITPILVTIILFTHPQTKISLLRNWIKSFEKQKSRQSFYDQLITTNRTSVQVYLSQFNTDQQGYLRKLKQQNRACLLATILGCICLQQEQPLATQLFPWSYTDRYEYQVNDKIVSNSQHLFAKKLEPLNIKFISHAPTAFKYLLNLDKGPQFTIESQLNPNKNLSNIFKNAQTDGGASGQFFFFNYSNSLILKTMTSQQLQVLLDRLKQYTNHFKNARNSLIVKLYGIYTAQNPQTGQHIHFMIMGNLLGPISKKYASRMYDMKGSQHKRQVYKDIQSVQWYDKTMKDTDFQRLQTKVWVSESDSRKIKKVLTDDSLHFMQLGLIDYSLIVIKVDYNAFLLDQQDFDPFDKRTMFKSIKQPGVVYILGIIDYLETWNVKKKSQRWYKSIFTKKQTISSQNPTFYSERFRQGLINHIFP